MRSQVHVAHGFPKLEMLEMMKADEQRNRKEKENILGKKKWSRHLFTLLYFTLHCYSSYAKLRGDEGVAGLCQEMTRADLPLTILGLKNVWPMRQTLKAL